MQHVAIFMSALPIGSRERVIFRLAAMLIERGARVDLLVPAPTPAIRAQAPAGARLLDLNRWWMKIPFAGRSNLVRVALSPPALAAYLRRERPDVLLSVSIPPNLAALAARRFAGAGTRLVIRQSNVIHLPGHAEFGGVRRRWRDRLIPRWYPQADAIIAVSDGVARNLAALTGIGADKVHVIYNGVNLQDIEAKMRAPVELNGYGYADAPVLLAVGRLVAKKDYPTLLRALSRVRARHPARLVILGEGPMRGPLERLAAELGIADAVKLPGYCPNPYAHMARANLFVLSSISEGMPSALIEALACGCPVVSTDCPSGPAEILERGKYGTLAPVGDIAALAAAIETALDQPPPRALLRQRAAELSSERAAQRYLAVVEGVAGALN